MKTRTDILYGESKVQLGKSCSVKPFKYAHSIYASVKFNEGLLLAKIHPVEDCDPNAFPSYKVAPNVRIT